MANPTPFLPHPIPAVPPVSLLPPLTVQPLEVFQSITTMPEHQAFSFEELRVNHYRITSGAQVKPPAAATADNMGKAAAAIPFDTVLSKAKYTCSTTAADHRPYGSDIITFIVGKSSPKEFVIHHAVATTCSEFVRDAMKEGWKTAKDRMIPLPDDEPGIFGIYQTWLYAHSIPTDYASDDEDKTLVEAYILGDKLRDINFKDAVADCVMKRLRTTKAFDLRLTNLVYDNTLENSPLRRLWRDIYGWAGNASWLEDDALSEPINADFMKQLIQYQYKIHNTPGFKVGLPVDACAYHEHVKGECYIVKLLSLALRWQIMLTTPGHHRKDHAKFWMIVKSKLCSEQKTPVQKYNSPHCPHCTL